MSPASAPQRDKTSSAPEPAGASAPAAPAGGWAAAAARYGPAGVVAAAMVVLGWWGIARDNSMGNDEVATRWAALLPLRELGHLLGNVDAVHGLYYLLMHGWVALGSSPVVLRIPSVIAMTAAAVLTVIIGTRLTGSGWAGLFAGLIMVLTPVISFYAQTARSYAMVLACVLGSTLALVYALEAEAAGRADGAGASGGLRWLGRRWLTYTGLIALGGYLNEMSLLVLAAHAITVLLSACGRPALERWAAAAARGVALAVPLVLISATQHGAVGWIPRPGLTDLKVLFRDYFGVTTAVAVLLAVCAAAALVPPPGTWRRRRAGQATAAPGPAWWRSGGISLPSVAAPLLVVPAALLIGESLVAVPLYTDRYVLYGEAGAALLAGAGSYRIGRWLCEAAGRRGLIWVPGVIVCLCALVLQLAPQHRVRTPESRRYDYGGPSRYVGANARPGDGVLFFGTFYRKARLGYPRDFAHTSDFALAVPPAQAGDFRGRDQPFDVTFPRMLDHRRIWVIGARPSARLPAGPMRQESMVLERDFSLIAERHFRGMVVTLWLRRCPLAVGSCGFGLS